MKHTFKFTFLAFLVVALLGIAIVPVIGQDSGGGTITWGVKTEATGIDVQTNGQSPSRQLFNFVYEQLVDLDEDLNVVPGLADIHGNKSTIRPIASICGRGYTFPMGAR